MLNMILDFLGNYFTIDRILKYILIYVIILLFQYIFCIVIYNNANIF